MSYEFPADVQKLVDEQMAAGNYGTEDELLRAALSALTERDNVVEEDPAVIEGIRRGLADVEAGRGRPFEEFDAEFRAKHNLP